MQIVHNSLTAVVLHERDIDLLRHRSTCDMRNLVLVVDTEDIRKTISTIGHDPRIVSILKMSGPDVPGTADHRAFMNLVRNGFFCAAEVWCNTPVRPSKFNNNFKRPDLMLAYSGYRYLRYAGFDNITLRAQGWSEMVTPFPMVESMVNRHAGKRCFVVGNGPSLNNIDMTRLANEITFGSNRVFMGFERWGFDVTYWAIEDRLQIERYYQEYDQGLGDHITKFVPFDYVTLLDMSNTYYIPLLYGNGQTFPGNSKFPLFSNKPGCIYHGFTVTYSLIQLAALMGCSEIYLVGLDHFYGLPSDKLGTTLSGTDNKTWLASDSRVATHFDERYTSARNEFVKPRPLNSEIAYACARQWCDTRGIVIRNATPGSHLDVYKKIDYDSLF